MRWKLICSVLYIWSYRYYFVVKLYFLIFFSNPCWAFFSEYYGNHCLLPWKLKICMHKIVSVIICLIFLAIALLEILSSWLFQILVKFLELWPLMRKHIHTYLCSYSYDSWYLLVTDVLLVYVFLGRDKNGYNSFHFSSNTFI